MTQSDNTKEEYKIIKPRSKFQSLYLNANENFLIVGGAAGSSKSYVGLMRHLRFIEDPNYRGICIRKNSTAIMKIGGLFEEAVSLYRQYCPDIGIKIKDQKITFPSGAAIAFSHYENRNAAQLYQGLQFSGIMYDESSHSEEEDIWWLQSRLRSKANCPHSIWLTVNPDPDSWILKYVNWYLYQDGHPLAGRPDPELNGKTRWLLRIGGEIVWGETREELILKYGKKSLPADHPDQVKPRSFRALFGTIDDNPPLLALQPDYKANLESMPYADCERLRWGNWFARPSGSNYVKRSDFVELTIPPSDSEFVEVVRAWDFAGTLPSDNLPNPDYFASVKMGKTREGNYVIIDVTRTRITFGKWKEYILDKAKKDGKNVLQILPEDPNPQAKANAFTLASEIRSYGYPVLTKKSNTKKMEMFRPFAAATENKLIHIVKGCCKDEWNKVYGDNSFYFNELEAFDGERHNTKLGKDDMVDCTSLAFLRLSTKTRINSNFMNGVLSVKSDYRNPLLNIN
jgi:phage terminase large subunit-like protein